MKELEKRLTILVHKKTIGFLDRVVEMLADGLRELSIEPELVDTMPNGLRGRALVLGGNFYTSAELAHLPEDSIIFNVENSSSIFWTDEYRRILRRFRAWDFSYSNAVFISNELVRPVYYIKMFYVDRLKRIVRSSEEDIDVLFYGSFNARRTQVLDALKARGLRVKAVYRVFGADLDKLIARSKVVINVHFYDNGRLELIRIFDLLANGRAVVSELNPGESVDADLVDAFVGVPYEEIVDATEAVVRDFDRREKLARAGFQIFSQRRASDILGDALAWSGLPRPSGDAVIGSGKMYNPRMLNIDIDDRWHPDIVADIADTTLFEREFNSRRFGACRLQRGWFDNLIASHVLEHVRDLVRAMTNCLELLGDGGIFRITVPYDLSYGAWQDPTHLHAFNERSWLYYCEWYWYLGWTESRFDLVELSFNRSALGNALAEKGIPQEEILRSPRAVDEMSVVLRKRPLTEAERALGRQMRGDDRA
jgi:SAM-dependent methyltransferase